MLWSIEITLARANTRTMISIRDVSKSFSAKNALNRVSMELPGSKTHVFLGSSGSGKSTLLRIIAGLIEADQGEVYLGADRMTRLSQPELSSKIGFMLQEGGLFPHLTAEENVLLMAKSHNWTPTQISARFGKLTEILNLDSALLKKYPRQLSGGERQRTALMRALFLDPPILLLDEPLGSVDPLVRHNLQKELKNIFSNLKKLVIFVTHDLNEAAFMGDSISLFHEGRLVQSGPPDELWNQPKDSFVTEFVNAQRPYNPNRVGELR